MQGYDASEVDMLLDELEQRLDRLRALYEQFFLGFEKLEPTVQRKDVDRRFWVLRRMHLRNTATRFKLNTLTQRYNTYRQYWQRNLRQIEAGTFKRHLALAEKRLGKEALTIAARRSPFARAQSALLARNSEPPSSDTEYIEIIDEIEEVESYELPPISRRGGPSSYPRYRSSAPNSVSGGRLPMLARVRNAQSIGPSGPQSTRFRSPSGQYHGPKSIRPRPLGGLRSIPPPSSAAHSSQSRYRRNEPARNADSATLISDDRLKRMFQDYVRGKQDSTTDTSLTAKTMSKRDESGTTSGAPQPVAPATRPLAPPRVPSFPKISPINSDNDRRTDGNNIIDQQPVAPVPAPPPKPRPIPPNLPPKLPPQTPPFAPRVAQNSPPSEPQPNQPDKSHKPVPE